MAALKALIVKEIITSAFPKTNKTIRHFNKPFFLVRTTNSQPANELIFRAKSDINKLELRQILKQVYGIQTIGASSWNKMGKITMSRKTRSYYRKPDFKKLTVKCAFTVPPNLQTIKG